MAVRRFYTVIEEKWDDEGNFVRTQISKPIQEAEAQLLEAANKMRAVNSAQQVLLEHYGRQGLKLNLPKPQAADFMHADGGKKGD